MLLKIQNMMDIKEVLLLWFTSLLIEKPQVVALIIKLSKINNWLNNYTNQLLKKWKKRVHSLFKDNICGADLTDMQLISKFNKGTRFCYVLLICLVNIHGLFL